MPGGNKGSTAPAQQTVTQKTELPAWVSQASQDNYTDATNVAKNLAAPVQQTLNPLNQNQYDAWGLAQGGLQAGSGALSSAVNMLSGGGQNVTPREVTGTTVTADQIAQKQMMIEAMKIAGLQQTVGAKTFSADALQPYLNPYTDQVVNAGLSDLERQRQLTQVTNGDAAAAAGAFGGSRHAIQEGVTNAESARAAGSLSAQLRDQAFNTAAGLLNTDNDRVLRADMSNQATNLAATQSDQSADLSAKQSNQATNLAATKADQSSKLTADLANQATALDVSKSNAANWLSADTGNANRNLATAAQLAALGQQQQNSVWQQASIDEGIGDRLQGWGQQYYDTQAANANALRNYPIEQLNLKVGTLAQSPYGETKTTTGPATQQGGNSLLGLLGGAAQGASIASTLGLAGGSGGLIGAGAGGLLGLLALSDRSEKTDIKRVGKDPKTGLPLYSYRYKGDPKTYPKVVGPMAQDIEKKYPGAVKKLPGTGKRAVNAGFLGGVMATPVSAAPGGGDDDASLRQAAFHSRSKARSPRARSFLGGGV